MTRITLPKLLYVFAFLLLSCSLAFAQVPMKLDRFNSPKKAVKQLYSPSEKIPADAREADAMYAKQKWLNKLASKDATRTVSPIIDERCGTTIVEEMRQRRYPNRPSTQQFEKWMEEQIHRGNFAQNRAVTTIPVVIHIIHNGEAVGTGSNISDAQAFSQIDVLNEDFRRMNADAVNTPADFLGVAADVELEFCLATVDPDGNPTNGLNRFNGGQTSYSLGEMENFVKPATAWNPEYYLNMWCAPLEGGLLGYAQFPDMSTLPGLPPDIGPAGPDYTDGVVTTDVAFGVGGSTQAPFNLGRTMTHEVGHFFGLRHIWGDGGCGIDDFCADTPTQGANNGGLGDCTFPGPNTCDDGEGDLPDMFQNYMDYSDDVCMNLFTQNQKDRVNVVLANSPRRNFANSQVCNGVQPPFWEPDLPDPPANDLCADAIQLSCGDSLTGTTTAATSAGAPGNCSTSVTAPGVWYTIEGTGGAVTISLCGSSFDTKLTVYQGDCDGLACVAGNDDLCGLSSQVTFGTTTGVTYYAYVSGFSSETGDFVMEVSCTDGPGTEAPENDLCEGAITIECGGSVDGSTVDATSNDGPTDFCGTSPTAPGVWYTFVGDGQAVVLSTCNQADYDTKINVYEGSCDALVCVTGNDDGAGCSGFTSETIPFLTSVGVTYFVYVNGYFGEVGDFTLSMECVSPPENDLCEDAIMVSCGDVVSGNTLLASDIGAPATDCGPESPFSNDMGPGVWYQLVGNGDFIQLSTCSDANFDTKIDVFTGACGELTCVAGNDDGAGCEGFTSAFGFQSENGVTYYIYVSGFTVAGQSTSQGEFTLSVCPGCKIEDVSLDPFHDPDGGLFCLDDGTYFLSLRVDGVTPGALPRDGFGNLISDQFKVVLENQPRPIVGIGFDNVTIPGENYLFLEIGEVPGDGGTGVETFVQVANECTITKFELYDEPTCAQPPPTECTITDVSIYSGPDCEDGALETYSICILVQGFNLPANPTDSLKVVIANQPRPVSFYELTSDGLIICLDSIPNDGNTDVEFFVRVAKSCSETIFGFYDEPTSCPEPCTTTDTELIVNGDFETGDLEGWSIGTTGGSFGFNINDGTYETNSGLGPIAPIDGNYDVVTDQGGPGSALISQPFIVPSGIEYASLSWEDRIHNFAEIFEDPGQEFRVTLRDTGQNTISVLWSTDPGDSTIQFGPNMRRVNMTSTLQGLAGEEVCVAFEQADDIFFFNVTLDNISLIVGQCQEEECDLDIVSYTLINADTDMPVEGYDPIAEGATIDLCDLDSPVNIRANVCDENTNSVNMVLSGASSQNQTENVEPYALFGDFQGDYTGKFLPAGDYTLVGTAYDGNGGSGNAGDPATLNFSVADCSNARVGTYPTDFKVYPNPSNGQFTVEYGQGDDASLSIFNSLGQAVFADELQAFERKTVNLAQFDNGLYIVRVQTINGQLVKRLLLQK